jgi:hypothetical protein
MVQELAFAASLETPPWAEASDPDEEAVIHSRRMADLIDLDGGELAVDLVQRDDLCLTDDGVALVREPAWARVAGVRIGLDQAACLAGMLISAKEMAERAESTSRMEGNADPTFQVEKVADSTSQGRKRPSRRLGWRSTPIRPPKGRRLPSRGLR